MMMQNIVSFIGLFCKRDLPMHVRSAAMHCSKKLLSTSNDDAAHYVSFKIDKTTRRSDVCMYKYTNTRGQRVTSDLLVVLSIFYTYIQIYIHTYIHIYIHTYIHIYIHTYIHIYIHNKKV